MVVGCWLLVKWNSWSRFSAYKCISKTFVCFLKIKLLTTLTITTKAISTMLYMNSNMQFKKIKKTTRKHGERKNAVKNPIEMKKLQTLANNNNYSFNGSNNKCWCRRAFLYAKVVTASNAYLYATAKTKKKRHLNISL